MNLSYGIRNINFMRFSLKKSPNKDNSDEKDNLLLQLYHTSMDINKIDREINELKNLYSNEENENITHKNIINKILQGNHKIKIKSDINSSNNDKNKSEILEEKEDMGKKSKRILKSVKKN